jgi:hypothetical protein
MTTSSDENPERILVGRERKKKECQVSHTDLGSASSCSWGWRWGAGGGNTLQMAPTPCGCLLQRTIQPGLGVPGPLSHPLKHAEWAPWSFLPLLTHSCLYLPIPVHFLLSSTLFLCTAAQPWVSAVDRHTLLSFPNSNTFLSTVDILFFFFFFLTC